ncbi:hypothetical protein HDU93_007238, partial [Gonapodya sp. JEL0774]
MTGVSSAAQPVSLDLASSEELSTGTETSGTSVWLRAIFGGSKAKAASATVKRPVFKAAAYSESDRVNVFKMEQVVNFRDLLEGKMTQDGKKLKQGVIFRSGTL